MSRLDLTEAQAYGDGWDEGREDMLKALQAIAFHWEREQGGDWERMREGARWTLDASICWAIAATSASQSAVNVTPAGLSCRR